MKRGASASPEYQHLAFTGRKIIRPLQPHVLHISIYKCMKFLFEMQTTYVNKYLPKTQEKIYDGIVSKYKPYHSFSEKYNKKFPLSFYFEGCTHRDYVFP